MFKNFIITFLLSKVALSLFIPDPNNGVHLEDFEIKVEKNGQHFPEKFSFTSTYNGNYLVRGFEVVSDSNLPAVSHFADGKFRTIQFDRDHQFYKEKNGRGFATLFGSENNYRMFGRLFNDDSNYIDIHATPSKKGRLNQLSFDHYLHESNSDDKNVFKDDVLRPPKDVKLEYKHQSSGKARVFNGNPVTLDVETLVVADPTVYEDQKKYLGTTDDNAVFQFMRTYFAHLINGVNDKYQNTLGSDPDLRINVKLVHLLILTNPTDATWTQIGVVGDSTYATYNGKEVILTTKTLNELAGFMKRNNNFGISFDHVLGVFNKDLWSENTLDAPESRTGVAGVAWLGTICATGYSTSVSEEYGGFKSLYVIAHELGHNLGSDHDGLNNLCLASDQFIMSPSISYSKISNIQKFSSCSIAAFKSKLLVSNTVSSSTAACLTIASNTVPDYVKNANFSLTGQYWGPDQQCKMIRGPDAFFYQPLAQNMCAQMYCSVNLNATSYSSSGPAVEGSPCASGSVCRQGLCTITANSMVSSCPFGDFNIYGTYYPGLGFSTAYVSCPDFFKASILKGYSIPYLCKSSQGSRCCSSCLKYQPLLTCVDKYYNCPQLTAYCTGTIGGEPGSTACPFSCKNCPGLTIPLTCSTNYCQNGGTCVSASVSGDGLIAFDCKCPSGFTGPLCETKLSTLLPSSNTIISTQSTNSPVTTTTVRQTTTTTPTNTTTTPTTTTPRPTTTTPRPTTTTPRPTTTTPRPTTTTPRPTTTTPRPTTTTPRPTTTTPRPTTTTPRPTTTTPRPTTTTPRPTTTTPRPTTTTPRPTTTTPRLTTTTPRPTTTTPRLTTTTPRPTTTTPRPTTTTPRPTTTTTKALVG